eukprot:Lankesteria_metandrocarpae@DN3223_c0_g1_i1.p1
MVSPVIPVGIMSQKRVGPSAIKEESACRRLDVLRNDAVECCGDIAELEDEIEELNRELHELEKTVQVNEEQSEHLLARKVDIEKSLGVEVCDGRTIRDGLQSHSDELHMLIEDAHTEETVAREATAEQVKLLQATEEVLSTVCADIQSIQSALALATRTANDTERVDVHLDELLQTKIAEVYRREATLVKEQTSLDRIRAQVHSAQTHTTGNHTTGNHTGTSTHVYCLLHHDKIPQRAAVRVAIPLPIGTQPSAAVATTNAVGVQDRRAAESDGCAQSDTLLWRLSRGTENTTQLIYRPLQQQSALIADRHPMPNNIDTRTSGTLTFTDTLLMTDEVGRPSSLLLTDWKHLVGQLTSVHAEGFGGRSTGSTTNDAVASVFDDSSNNTNSEDRLNTIQGKLPEGYFLDEAQQKRMCTFQAQVVYNALVEGIDVCIINLGQLRSRARKSFWGSKKSRQVITPTKLFCPDLESKLHSVDNDFEGTFKSIAETVLTLLSSHEDLRCSLKVGVTCLHYSNTDTSTNLPCDDLVKLHRSSGMDLHGIRTARDDLSTTATKKNDRRRASALIDALCLPLQSMRLPGLVGTASLDCSSLAGDNDAPQEKCIASADSGDLIVPPKLNVFQSAVTDSSTSVDLPMHDSWRWRASSAELTADVKTFNEFWDTVLNTIQRVHPAFLQDIDQGYDSNSRCVDYDAILSGNSNSNNTGTTNESTSEAVTNNACSLKESTARERYTDGLGGSPCMTHYCSTGGTKCSYKDCNTNDNNKHVSQHARRSPSRRVTQTATAIRIYAQSPEAVSAIRNAARSSAGLPGCVSTTTSRTTHPNNNTPACAADTMPSSHSNTNNSCSHVCTGHNTTNINASQAGRTRVRSNGRSTPAAGRTVQRTLSNKKTRHLNSQRASRVLERPVFEILLLDLSTDKCEYQTAPLESQNASAEEAGGSSSGSSMSTNPTFENVACIFENGPSESKLPITDSVVGSIEEVTSRFFRLKRSNQVAPAVMVTAHASFPIVTDTELQLLQRLSKWTSN